MSAKHTPGPWSAVEHGAWDFSVEAQGTVCRIDNKGKWFPSRRDPCATVGRSQNAMAADARLIAAAPELLEALAVVLLETEEALLEPTQRKARAAIAKATGSAS